MTTAGAAGHDERGRVIVVGSVNVDLVVRVGRLPAPGETVIGGTFSKHHGGKGGNQAVAAARLGAYAVFIGAVGDDGFGREARAALDSEGVDTTHLRTLPDASTGVALILVDSDGENSIAVAGGANAALTPDHVRVALHALAPTPADVVLVGHEIPTAATAVALRAGRSVGATTVLNPAPVVGLDVATVALADILTPNEGELAELRQKGIEAPVTLVSLGAAGARLTSTDGILAIPAPTVDAIDTVGAGDTLNGALAAGLAAGMSLPDASRRGVIAASLAVTRAGAREGMPTRDELDAQVAR